MRLEGWVQYHFPVVTELQPLQDGSDLGSQSVLYGCWRQKFWREMDLGSRPISLTPGVPAPSSVTLSFSPPYHRDQVLTPWALKIFEKLLV